MLSIRPRFCRVCTAVLVLAGVAWPGSLSAQTVLRAQPQVERQPIAVLLGERGWPDGVQLHGHLDRRTVHLPTAAAPGAVRGSLRLAFEARLPGYRHASLELRINDRAAEAIDLLHRPGGQVDLPLSPSDLARPYVAIEAILRGSINDDRCLDERLAGGFVTLSPASGLHLVPNPELRPDVWRTLAALPQRVEIGFAGNPADPVIFTAALTTAAALARTGHEPVFRGQEGAVLGGEGRYDLVRLEAEDRPPDVIIGEPTDLGRALAAIGSDGTGIVTPAGARPGADDLLAAVAIGSRTVLAVTPAAAAGLAMLASRGLTPLAAGPMTHVEPLPAVAGTAPAILRLGELAADLGRRRLVDEAEWRFAVPVTRLPIGHAATNAVLDLLIPPGLEADRAGEPVLARAVVDGELVGAWRLPSGTDPIRLRVPLDRAGTRLVSDVRLLLQRPSGAGDCRSQLVPIEVDLLPSSHLELRSVEGVPENFAELAARLGQTVKIVVEPNLLRRPAELLRTLTPVVEQLVRGGARLSVEANGEATDSGATILVGQRFAGALTSPVPLDRGSVAVTSRDGVRLAELSPAAPLAVLQLARRGGEPVLWLAGNTTELPAWRPGRLDRENVVIGDAQGTRIGFDRTTDRAIAIELREAASWAERLGGGRAALVAVAWLLLTLAALWIARRRRRPAVLGG